MNTLETTMNRWKISTIMRAIRDDERLSFSRRDAAAAVIDAMRGVQHDSAEHVISRMPLSSRDAAGLGLWGPELSSDVEAALVAYARRNRIAKDAP
jgi:hypothetical protein